MEGQPQVSAILKHLLLDFLWDPTEYSCRLAAGSYEGRSLVVRLVWILLQSQPSVKEAPDLTDLPIGKVCYNLTDELDYLHSIDIHQPEHIKMLRLAAFSIASTCDACRYASSFEETLHSLQIFIIKKESNMRGRANSVSLPLDCLGELDNMKTGQTKSLQQALQPSFHICCWPLVSLERKRCHQSDRIAITEALDVH